MGTMLDLYTQTHTCIYIHVQYIHVHTYSICCTRAKVSVRLQQWTQEKKSEKSADGHRLHVMYRLLEKSTFRMDGKDDFLFMYSVSLDAISVYYTLTSVLHVCLSVNSLLVYVINYIIYLFNNLVIPNIKH